MTVRLTKAGVPFKLTKAGRPTKAGGFSHRNGSRSKGADWPRITPARIAKAFIKSAGVVSDAAKILKCTNDTIYLCMKNHPELRDARIEAIERTLDMAESSLFAAIKKGDVAATKFFLETKGKHRGYTRRQEITGLNGNPIEVSNARTTFIAELAEIGARLGTVISDRTLGPPEPNGADPLAEAAD